jgi:hypothetical protein
MIKFVKSKKGIALLLAIAAVAAAAVGAYAYFTATGTATGGATVGSATPWGVSAINLSGPALVPGGAFDTIDNVVVTNNSAGFQGLNTITAHISVVTGTSFTTENPCTAADFQFTAGGGKWSNSNPGDDSTITFSPAKDIASNGTYNVPQLKISMIDSGSPQDNCQAAALSVTYTAS